VMQRNGQARKPLWITEFGLPASKGKAHSKNPLQTTDRGMARWLTGAYRDIASGLRKPALRVTRAYWYTWASEYRGDIFRYTGLLRYRLGATASRKPAYSAYAKVARELTR
jgi:hypothetical protein